MSTATDEATTAPTPARSRTVRRVWFLLAVLAVLAVSAWIAQHRVTEAFRRQIPEMPDRSRMNATMATQIAEADARARSNPIGPDLTLGGLGMIYQANLYLKEALVCYDLAIKHDPSAWVWRYTRALALRDLGEEEELVKVYEDVVRVSPSIWLGWYRLGEAWLKVGDDAKAEKAFRKARECNAADEARRGNERAIPGRLSLIVHARLGEAQAILRQGRLDEALRIAQDLAAQRPGFGPAWNLMEQVYRVQGLNDEAERCYKRSWGAAAFPPPTDSIELNLQRKSSNPTYLLYAADLAKRAGDMHDTLLFARRAAEVVGDEPETLVSIARVLVECDEPAEALRLFERAVKLSPEHVAARSGLAVSLSATGRQFAAVNLMRSVVASNPRDAEARFRLGLVLQIAGDPRGAEAEYRKALELDIPDSGGVARQLGKMLNTTGRFDDARKVFEAALAKQKNDWNQRIELAVSLTGLGRHADAAEQLREASLYTPDDARLLHDWCESLLRTGDARAAATVAERIPVVEPSSAKAHFYFAQVAAKAGRHADAAYHCEVALRLRPEFPEAAALLADAKSRPSVTTPTDASPPSAPVKAQGSAKIGAELYRAYCAACHTSDGSPGIGPTFHRLLGRERVFTDGSRLIADDAYVRDSILDPQRRIVQGFQPLMPKVRFDEKQLASVVEFIKTLRD